MTADTCRWRLDLAYDGTNFAGWAKQPGQRTVQAELEHWLFTILRLPGVPDLVCAGRTDAGVHARGQVAHVDLPRESIDDGGRELHRRLTKVLHDDLVVRSVTVAPPHFDARFGAIWRRYVYRICDGGLPPDPLYRFQVTRLKVPVDVDVMNGAGQALLGLRDFAAFCRKRPGATTIRTLLGLHGSRIESGPMAGVAEFTVRADAFCHSMVRSLMGGVVAVGQGRQTTDWLTQVAQSGTRIAEVETLPARGLTLEEVGYPGDDQLAARARDARSLRGVPHG